MRQAARDALSESYNFSKVIYICNINSIFFHYHIENGHDLTLKNIICRDFALYLQIYNFFIKGNFINSIVRIR
jgi:hypothetical protein